MHAISFIAGLACVFFVLLDAFQTVILPRRATGRFRITKLFYVSTWRPWKYFTKRICTPRTRETAFSFYGPLSLIFLIMVWAGTLLIGFSLLYFGLGSPFNDVLGRHVDFLTDLYVSGTTIFTLGLGDIVPHYGWTRILIILESGTGLAFVAVVIGYFPVLYGAFSRRESTISLLDARAGSPPTALELLRRHSFEGGNDALVLLLEEWERWSAELLESHISYPLLCYFRSQHTNQSWLSALVAVLDTCSLLIAGVQGHPARQAQLTFAMARHALVDLSQVFGLMPKAPATDRLPPAQFEKLYSELCQASISVCRDNNSKERLLAMRALYEGHAETLSDYLCMPMPPWVPSHAHKDNWQTVARLRAEAEANTAEVNDKALSVAGFDDANHEF
ncbi:MAG TPA: potassium channel family protein [Acidisarcina sp.]